MTAIETLISVLCGPDGKCCISGSDDDRRLIDSALADIAQATEPVAWLSPWRKDQVTTDYDAYGKQGIPLYAAPQPVAREPLDEARRMFDAGWKAAALFCDREDVVADGIIGFGASPQFEAAFSAAQPVAREPLTDEQIAEMMRDTWGCASIAPRHALEFARAVERAHGIAQKGGS